jgi:hypothetical protein
MVRRLRDKGKQRFAEHDSGSQGIAALENYGKNGLLSMGGRYSVFGRDCWPNRVIAGICWHYGQSGFTVKLRAGRPIVPSGLGDHVRQPDEISGKELETAMRQVDVDDSSRTHRHISEVFSAGQDGLFVQCARSSCNLLCPVYGRPPVLASGFVYGS